MPTPSRSLAEPALIQAVLFDFDGTLSVQTLDFEEMRRRVLTVIAEYLPAFTPPVVPAMEMLTVCHARLPQARAEAFRQKALQVITDMEVKNAEEGTLFPFTKPLLKRLKERGLRTGIVTRNCRLAVEKVFPDHAAFCDCLFCREDVHKVKPAPEHLLAALRLLKVPPANALMIGDHPMDIQLAHSAGSQSAAVSSGGSSLEDLGAARPDYLAVDLEDLLRQLGW